MKALVNPTGKFLQVVDGKLRVSETPTTFEDNVTMKNLPEILEKQNVKASLDGYKLVSVDAVIDKPKTRYVLSKSK